MKIPKKIRVLNKTIKLIADKNISGGSFDWTNKTIRYGSTGSIEFQIEVLIHEIIEMILTVRDLRWTHFDGPEMNHQMVFVFNHEQYDHVCVDIAGVVNQLLGVK